MPRHSQKKNDGAYLLSLENYCALSQSKTIWLHVSMLL